MITETVMGILIDVIFWIINTALSLLPAPPQFALPVPRQIWELLTIAIQNATLFFAPALIWWIWRQVKA